MEMDMKNLPTTALMVLFLIVVVAVGATLLQEMKGTSSMTEDLDSTIVNESFLIVDSGDYREFANTPVTSIVQIVNTSNGYIIAVGNYTLTNATHWQANMNLTYYLNDTNMSV